MTARNKEYRRLGFILVFFLIGLLYPFQYGYRDVVIQRFGDALHLPLFFVIAALAFRFLMVFKAMSSALAICCAAGVAMVIDVAIEVIQPFTGRSESWIDLRNGLTGIAIFVLWKILIQRLGTFQGAGVTGLALIAGSIWALQPAIAANDLRNYQSSHFPVLADFQNTNELKLWGSSDSAARAAQLIVLRVKSPLGVESSLQVRTVPGQFSGVEFDAYGFDWKGYSKLGIEVSNPDSEPLPLNVRIDDRGDVEQFPDRYNGAFTVENGEQQIEIDLADVALARNGRFNLSDISRILIFTGPIENSRIFTIRRIALR